jgi:hypothetical protein
MFHQDQEHHQHIRLYHWRNWPYENTDKLESFSYMMPVSWPENLDQITGDAIEIELHPNNINREDGFSLNRSWNPLIHILKGQKNDRTCTSS